MFLEYTNTDRINLLSEQKTNILSPKNMDGRLFNNIYVIHGYIILARGRCPFQSKTNIVFRPRFRFRYINQTICIRSRPFHILINTEKSQFPATAVTTCARADLSKSSNTFLTD